MHKTKNDLSLKVRKAAIEILNQRLADCLDVAGQTKQAHWNVKGPSFIALHELFDTVAGVLYDASDLIAERVTALGGIAEGTAKVVAKRSTMPDYPLDISQGREHVDALTTSLAAFGKAVRADIDKTDKLGDKDTADLFTGVSRDVDKYLWFVEAHMQAEA